MFKDLKNQKFGLILVLSFSHKDKNYKTYWNCVCDCGTTLIMRADQLLSRNVPNCGCITGLLQSQKPSLKTKSSAINRLLRAYKRNAKKFGRDFSLSDDDFVSLILDNCYYCGSAPNNICKIKNKYSTIELFYNGIDRVNNKRGYTVDNCVSCCRLCNFAKRELSLSDFLDWLRKIIFNLEKIKLLIS